MLILHEVTELQSQCCSMLFKNIQVKNVLYFGTSQTTKFSLAPCDNCDQELHINCYENKNCVKVNK